MSPEKDDERSARDLEDEMEDEAVRMQKRVDELGEQAQDADKKADIVREHGEPDKPGEPLGAVAADEGGADDEPEDKDDEPEDEDDDADGKGDEPGGADDEPEDKDDDADAKGDDADAKDDDDRG